MNIFGTTSLIIFASSIGFALFLYSGNRKSRVTRAWFLASGSIALWGLGLFGVTSSGTSEMALRWQYLLDLSAIFIPVLYFSFVSEFLHSHNYAFRRFSLFLAALLSIFSFSPLFKIGMALHYGIFWIVPGRYYFVFPFFFTLYTIFSLVLMAREYRRNTTNFLYRAQIRNTFLAGLIGFGGGITNFFPQVFNIYPFGNYFVILYIFFMAYGVLRYRLLDSKIISTQFFSAALVLIFLFNLLQPVESVADWAIRFLIFALVIFFSILLVRGVYREVEQREKIEKLARELEGANEKLKELDRLKSEFVSLASHQLRGPLTAIRGYVSMILEGDYGTLSESLAEPLEVVSQSSKALAETVEDFLNVSRIEQGRMKYDFERGDLSAIVKEVAHELEPNVEKKGLSLATDITPGLSTTFDAGKIRQVVTNLIDNAVKYTKEGNLAVTLKGDKDKALLTVKDSGVGMDPKTMNKLFLKFSRAEDASKFNILGTGLGLYVAKQFVDAHHGRVWAESAGPGKGSTFFVELPIVNS